MAIGPAGIRPRTPPTAESLNWKEGPTRVSARASAYTARSATRENQMREEYMEELGVAPDTTDDFFDVTSEVGAAFVATIMNAVKLIFVTSSSEAEIISKLEWVTGRLRSHVYDCLEHGGNPFNDEQTIETYEKDMYEVSERALHVAHWDRRKRAVV